MEAIAIEKLTKNYTGKKGASVQALKMLDLTLDRGEVFGFLGPNGAGKSTTIKLLMGLIAPTSGTAYVNGIDISHASARAEVGYLPENPAFYDYLTAEEYLAFVAGQFNIHGEEQRRRCDEALHLFDLWDARKRSVRSYSKGMVQRLGLAQVLVHDPSVYILDEPMSGLDPLGRSHVKDVIRDLKQRGKTVFFSTHITSDVEQVCDRVGVILNGELKAVERVGDIMSSGICGYLVRTRGADGTTKEQTVMPDSLSETLHAEQTSGARVLLVEPLRKDLEQFFLGIVAGKSC